MTVAELMEFLSEVPATARVVMHPSSWRTEDTEPVVEAEYRHSSDGDQRVVLL